MLKHILDFLGTRPHWAVEPCFFGSRLHTVSCRSPDTRQHIPSKERRIIFDMCAFFFTHTSWRCNLICEKVKVEFACTWRWNVAQLSSVCMCSCNMHFWSIVQTSRVSLSLQRCQRLLVCMRATLWTYNLYNIMSYRLQQYSKSNRTLNSFGLWGPVLSSLELRWEHASVGLERVDSTPLPNVSQRVESHPYLCLRWGATEPSMYTYCKSFSICDAKTMPFQMPFKDMMSGNSHKWPYQTTSSRRKVSTSRKPKGRGAWALDEAFLTACGKPVAGKPGK